MENRILLIAPKYFDYYKIIIKELKCQGFCVDYVPDANTGIIYNLCKKNKLLLWLYQKWYILQILNLSRNRNYEKLLVIGGKLFSQKQWSYIINKISIKTRIMYQWDSVLNYNYLPLIKNYTKVYTFDRNDSHNYNINYLPLFYYYTNSNTTLEDIDIFFIGIWHSDRINILTKIYQQAKKQNIKCFFKVYYPYYLYLWMKFVKREKLNCPFWTFKKMNQTEVEQYYSKSKCIVDINHPLQSGLTMRTIEAIGKQKKIITTNQNIFDEPFYNENDILIIDREVKRIDFKFLNTKTNYSEREKYHISNWLKNILNNS